jgi:proteasome assembly chaperone (PAC2) family protein
MIMGLSGWMDGGDVSTGTVEYLRDRLGAAKLAEIAPEGFYLLNMPGSMQETAVFRPHTRIEDGMVEMLEFPRNEFFFSEDYDLILFTGVEPNLRWKEYAGLVMDVVASHRVSAIYFAGSVASAVPHTRETRMHCSVSHAHLKEVLAEYRVSFTAYEGPASIVTLLLEMAARQSVEMMTLVTEIPLYVQGRNPRCIEAVMKRLLKLLGLESLGLDDLHETAERFTHHLDETVRKKPDLEEQVRKLEELYDSETLKSEMSDVEKWMREKGIKL